MPNDMIKARRDVWGMDHWAIGRLVDWAGGKAGSETTKVALREELDELTAELAGQTPSAAEMMLARTAAILWFTLRLHEGQYTDQAHGGAMNVVQSEHHQRRIDRTHRRLMSTLKTLATVRRLAVPAVQINLARQQVNQLNVGDSGGAGKAQSLPEEVKP